jgi:Tfp pilus assembly protein PilV
MTGRNPRAGVTLMETLVALLVMAMVATLLSSGLGMTARSFNRSDNVSMAIDEALARYELRLWLEHALPSSAPGDERPLFIGSASAMTFLSVPPSASFWPGDAIQVDLTAIPKVTAQGLSPDDRAARTQGLAIAPAETRLSFRYWGQISLDAAPDWHDAWPAAVGLPGLVRIDFEGLARPLPPMIIRPGKAWVQSEMSLSSLVPPALPSRP